MNDSLSIEHRDLRRAIFFGISSIIVFIYYLFYYNDNITLRIVFGIVYLITYVITYYYGLIK